MDFEPADASIVTSGLILFFRQVDKCHTPGRGAQCAPSRPQTGVAIYGRSFFSEHAINDTLQIATSGTSPPRNDVVDIRSS